LPIIDQGARIILIVLSPALMSAFGFAEPHMRGRG
jgi:hypothetical protein